jgi:cation diffusion facilitator CzcD-associated flavoprotein CzcO
MARRATPNIAIIGAGFGGICLAILLKKAGIESFTIFERAPDVGGVWRDNSYPGAACDVPSRLYAYSFEWDYPWTSAFAPQREIHAYIYHCVRRFGLRGHMHLKTGIAGATFNEGSGVWRLTTAAGETVEADVVVSAVGLFNKPWLPKLPGMNAFKGPQMHSARWNHRVDLTGKTVAAIGTGASAIQFVPELADVAGALHVYQRSPQYVLPMRRASPIDGVWDGKLEWLKRFKPWRWYERRWVFRDFESGIPRRASKELTAAGEAAFRAYLEAQVPDPELRRKLTPSYPLGCKRVLQSDRWYPALQRDNVELVAERVAELTADGITTEDGVHRPCDAVVYGTGFATTDYLVPMQVRGIGGQELSAAWRDGAEAFKGVTLAGFPNFFMLYGPNTNTAGSIIYMLESEARYILRCLKALDRKGAVWLMPSAEAQRAYNAEIQDRIAKTVLVADNCTSYFQAKNGKVTTQWPGFLKEFRDRTHKVDETAYVFGP